MVKSKYSDQNGPMPAGPRKGWDDLSFATTEF